MKKDLKAIINSGACLSSKEQLSLIDLKSRRLFKAYVKQNPLSEEAECKLLNDKNIAFLKIYLKYYWLSERDQCQLIDLKDSSLFYVYLKAHRYFDDMAIRKLMHPDNIEWFRSYVDVAPISRELESELVKKQNIDLFEAYVKKHTLFRQSLCSLINAKTSVDNTAMFDIYTDYWQLDACEELALVQSKKKDLFKIYLQKNTLCDHTRRELLRLKDVDLLEAYVETVYN